MKSNHIHLTISYYRVLLDDTSTNPIVPVCSLRGDRQQTYKLSSFYIYYIYILYIIIIIIIIAVVLKITYSI